MALRGTNDFVIADCYKIKRKIGSGSFGEIFSAINLQTGEEVAVKMEHIHARHQQLVYESKVYSLLSAGVGIPRVQYSGVENNYNCIVMDLLGHSLEDLFNICQRRFSLKTVLMLAEQMITRIEFMHNNFFIHRDIKPDNFLMGLGMYSTTVFMIDFGLAKRFKNPRTKVHIPYRDKKSLTGTARYASINAHKGIELSRRDDLESLGYVLMYFNRGSLPWQGLVANNTKQKYERISEKKMSTSIENLCRGYPEEFKMYLTYCRQLGFEQDPDYNHLRKPFQRLCFSCKYEYDWMFDWIVQKQQRQCVNSIGSNVGPSNSQPKLVSRVYHR
uniref:non-specific serine/threonine protein kinase n=1 Tax=Meloidogyne enterolobii TaxID=390850 RepID=A0A6V7WC28_MELEN|nr:unnamed protein product [Meloidogyne enterolobii]